MGSSKPLRVVVADDSAIMRRLLTDALTAHGFEVLSAVPDGDKALGACSVRRPDVLTLDVAMPGLPDSGGDPEAPPGKFADRVVPALLQEMTAIGARRSGLHAILVGGAQMFSFGTETSLDIGRRNERATREALSRTGIAVRAAATGGRTGRTVRVSVETGVVTVMEPGAAEVTLFARKPLLARSA